jgi:hypothetical protein
MIAKIGRKEMEDSLEIADRVPSNATGIAVLKQGNALLQHVC